MLEAFVVSCAYLAPLICNNPKEKKNVLIHEFRRQR